MLTYILSFQAYISVIIETFASRGLLTSFPAGGGSE